MNSNILESLVMRNLGNYFNGNDYYVLVRFIPSDRLLEFHYNPTNSLTVNHLNVDVPLDYNVFDDLLGYNSKLTTKVISYKHLNLLLERICNDYIHLFKCHDVTYYQRLIDTFKRNMDKSIIAVEIFDNFMYDYEKDYILG